MVIGEHFMVKILPYLFGSLEYFLIQTLHKEDKKRILG